MPPASELRDGASMFAAIWAATQWTDWRLGYQPQLGDPWLQLAKPPLYPPPFFFLWWYWFDAYAPKIFIEGAVIASSGGFAAIAIAIGLSVWRAHEAKEAVTYGSARWASAREVQAAGLLCPDGIVLGCFGRAYLRHDGPEHVLCFAPIRSGKGVGLVVPTLLTWPGSAIVHDIKGENWRLTAGWRARFGRLLNPNQCCKCATKHVPICVKVIFAEDAMTTLDLLYDDNEPNVDGRAGFFDWALRLNPSFQNVHNLRSRYKRRAHLPPISGHHTRIDHNTSS